SFHISVVHTVLHPFPTRRSSDLDEAALRRAVAAHDRGSGTVWAGDNRSGFHGAATCVRWIRSDADVAEAIAFFGARCDRVRVMRSEEHTSELQSRENLVCRLLLE